MSQAKIRLSFLNDRPHPSRTFPAGDTATHPSGLRHRGFAASRSYGARSRLVLRAEFGQGVPAGIEQHQHRSDFVFGADGQKLVQPFGETGGVLPEKSCRKTRMVFIPMLSAMASSFQLFGVEGVGLPHLQFIDGIGGGVIGTHEKRSLAYHALALAAGQRPGASTPGASCCCASVTVETKRVSKRKIDS